MRAATQPHEAGDPLARHTLSPAELKEVLAAEQSGEPFLAYRNREAGLRLFALGHGDAIRTIGRRAEMDLSLPWDSEVSGLHAELRRVSGEWTIVDDGLSTNGTFVNHKRIGARQRLRDGDRIRVGRTILVYDAANAAPARETIVAGEPLATPQLTDTQRRVLVALCRPYRDGTSFATPASNQQIAGEVFLSVDAVKMHLRTLFNRFGLGDLPQNQKRMRLAEIALQSGAVSQRDLA